MMFKESYLAIISDSGETSVYNGEKQIVWCWYFPDLSFYKIFWGLMAAPIETVIQKIQKDLQDFLINLYKEKNEKPPMSEAKFDQEEIYSREMSNSKKGIIVYTWIDIEMKTYNDC